MKEEKMGKSDEFDIIYDFDDDENEEQEQQIYLEDIENVSDGCNEGEYVSSSG